MLYSVALRISQVLSPLDVNTLILYCYVERLFYLNSTFSLAYLYLSYIYWWSFIDERLEFYAPG
jgi:hypothetical protein